MSTLEEIAERYLQNPDDDSVLKSLTKEVLAAKNAEELIFLSKKFKIDDNIVRIILEHCLELSNTSSELHCLLSRNYWFTDKEKSEKYAYRAIELDENNIDAMHILLGTYVTQDDGEKIKNIAKKALALDPTSRIARLKYTYALVFEDAREEAIKLLNEGIIAIKNNKDMDISDEESAKYFQDCIIGIKKGIDYQRLFLYPVMTHDDECVFKAAEEVLEKDPTHIIALVTYAKLYTVFVDNYGALATLRDAYDVYKKKGEAIPQELVDLEQAIMHNQVLDLSDIDYSLIEKMGK